jgi:hypothetical protein
MSYDIIPFEPTRVPEHIRGEMSELSKKLKRGNSLKRISIRNGVFRCIVGGEEIAKNKDGYMDIVVVNTTRENQRTYYKQAYDPNAEGAVAPDCFSPDGIVPHASAANPQAASCAECPMNVKGSGSGVGKKACRYSKRMAVALANDPDSGIYQVVIPSQSLFAKGDEKHMGWEQYQKFILSLNFSIDHIITRMSFDDDADSPKLVFSAVGHPGPSMKKKLEELAESPDAELAIQLPVQQTDNLKNPALPKPKIKALPVIDIEEDEEEEEAPPPPKAKKPAVIVEDDEDEDDDVVPPPSVKAKTAKPEPVTTAKGVDLNSIISRFAAPKATEVDDEEE